MVFFIKHIFSSSNQLLSYNIKFNEFAMNFHDNLTFSAVLSLDQTAISVEYQNSLSVFMPMSGSSCHSRAFSVHMPMSGSSCHSRAADHAKLPAANIPINFYI